MFTLALYHLWLYETITRDTKRQNLKESELNTT